MYLVKGRKNFIGLNLKGGVLKNLRRKIIVIALITVIIIVIISHIY